MSDKMKQTTRQTISWNEFPDMAHFWDAYIDMFWGNGGQTSYHDMLLSDENYLKQAYYANNELLTGLEQQYIGSTKTAQGQYEKGIEQSRVPISLGTSKPLMNRVPGGESDVQSNLLKSKLNVADKALMAGTGQATRQLNIAEKFAPHRVDMQYLKELERKGMQGQTMRTGLPLVEQTAKIPERGIADSISSWVGIGGGALDLIGSIGKINQKYPDVWDGSVELGRDLWKDIGGWSSNFWGWLTK